MDEYFCPQLQQQFQQHKLLEFQQQSKRQQAEKALPLDDLDFDSQKSSASYSNLQRLVALKSLQQNQHYEHQLQQQYENRDIIEEACASIPVRTLDHFDADDDLDRSNYYPNNQSKNFTMSPETTDYDSNCGDLDSEFSLKFISSERSFSSDFNGTNESARHHCIMPILEDGLSDTENNNSDAFSAADEKSNADIASLEYRKYASEISNIQANLNDFKIQQQADSELSNVGELHTRSDELESTLFNIRGTLERSKKLSSSINEALVHSGGITSKLNDSKIFISKESLSSTNAGENPVKAEDEEADTDLETDRLLGRQRMNELQKGTFDDNRVREVTQCLNFLMFFNFCLF